MTIFPGIRYPVVVAIAILAIIIVSNVATGSSVANKRGHGVPRVERQAVGSQINSTNTNDAVSGRLNQPRPGIKFMGKQKSTGSVTLPSDAQSRPPMSLLLQMKLVEPPTKNYLTYTECFNNTGKIRPVGWKAFLTVNATAAGIPPSSNPFIGYGINKTSARRIAAENALLAAYPRNLTYSIAETSLFKKYCDDIEIENVLQPQQPRRE